MGRPAAIAASDQLEKRPRNVTAGCVVAPSRLKLHILSIGHKPPAWVAAGFKDYVRRMPREARIELTEIKPASRSRQAQSAASISHILGVEKSRLLAAFPPGCVRIALDERGKQITTADLARKLTAWIGEERAAMYKKFVKEPEPGTAFVMFPMGSDEDQL